MHICHITINPIDYERRIQNQIMSAHAAGNRIWVLAIGRLDEDAQEETETYSLWRFRTRFYHGGPLKFINFNIKTIFFLLFKRFGIIHCHDLWVLPAAALLTLVLKCQLIYDAHEYYEGLEIFKRKKWQKKIWMLIESLCIGQVTVLLTVSEPIAQLYRNKYKKLKQAEVIRNLPLTDLSNNATIPLNWPVTDKKILLYQGHFRPGRGLEILIEAISHISDAHLVLIGDGELRPAIENTINKMKLEKQVTLLGYIPTNQLIAISSNADLGIVLFEPTSINYSYALPNKFFEYIMAGIPVLASNIQTFQEYINKYKIGLTVNPHDVEAIVDTIKQMLSDEVRMTQWKQNARAASQLLNWEQEAKKMNQIYEKL